jgi:hypothetical protein
MSKVVKLKQSDLTNIVINVLNEQNIDDFDTQVQPEELPQEPEISSDDMDDENLGQKFSDDLSGDITLGEDGNGQNYVLIKDAFTDNPQIVAVIPKD